jgi:hypothetical protein
LSRNERLSSKVDSIGELVDTGSQPFITSRIDPDLGSSSCRKRRRKKRD